MPKKDNNIMPRDVGKLLVQYSNLINGIYQQEASRFTYTTNTGRVSDKIKQDDLKSYITYQFITLVKEYDPHSEVDFPYYIKEKLTLRTRHSYIKKVFRDEWREVSDDTTSNSILANAKAEELNTQLQEEYGTGTLFDGVTLTSLEKAIIALWNQGITSNKAVSKAILEEAPDTDPEEVSETIAELKEFLRVRAVRKHLSLGIRDSNYDKLVERSKHK